MIIEELHESIYINKKNKSPRRYNQEKIRYKYKKIIRMEQELYKERLLVQEYLYEILTRMQRETETQKIEQTSNKERD